MTAGQLASLLAAATACGSVWVVCGGRVLARVQRERKPLAAHRVAFAPQLGAQPALTLAAGMGREDALGCHLPGGKCWLDHYNGDALLPRVVTAGADA